MNRIRISTGTPWEPLVGYSRLVRAGRHVYVTGTTATLDGGGHVGDGDAYGQTIQALANIERALARVGATKADIVRTRLFVTDIARDWREVGRAHAETLGDVRPATSMVEVSRLIEDWMLVEVETDAVVDPPAPELSGGVVIDEAGVNDHDAIAALLSQGELPVPGSEDPPVRVLVARSGGNVTGCVGWEDYGERALLRSLAVATGARGHGAGRALVEALCTRLQARGVGEVYLLTTTAAPFFEKLGFARVDRATVPQAVRASREFSMTCCASATAMHRALEKA